MRAIKKDKFLSELGKLLTFMRESDRKFALAEYENMFLSSENEDTLLSYLVSPTRQAVRTDLRIAFDKEVMIRRIIMQMLVVVPVECLTDGTGPRYPSRALHNQRLLAIRDKTHDPLRLVTPKQPRHLSVNASLFKTAIVIKLDAQHIRMR